MTKIKKDQEDNVMVEEDKRQMATSLDEMINEVQTMTFTKFDVVNQLLSANNEISKKVEEIAI